MRLHLMRHGIAMDREDPQCPAEAERPLTEEGLKKTGEVARGMRKIAIEPEIVLSSPYLRALQTAEIACAGLKFDAKKLIRTDALLPNAKPAQLFDELATFKANEALCCGHAPNLDLVIAFALGNRSVITELKKAGVATLEVESFAPPKAKLLALYPARTLRKITG
ncbi:MAG TPA: histidine phosphatase family protein [Candidatus Acidoferrales bacterium]|nr:histidine phosphatase family protein [Candidatus Acidoferrales bacterium]